MMMLWFVYLGILLFFKNVSSQSCSYNLKNSYKCHLKCQYLKGDVDDILQHVYIQDFTHEVCGTSVEPWHIQHITFQNNIINTIFGVALKKYPNLEVLDMNNNSIQRLSNTFKYNKKLKVVNLGDNSIKNMHIDLIKHLNKLTDFNLTGNPLNECDENTKNALNHLEKTGVKTYYKRNYCGGDFLDQIANYLRPVTRYGVYGFLVYLLVYLYRTLRKEEAPHRD